jgi:hypothetical protein
MLMSQDTVTATPRETVTQTGRAEATRLPSASR